MSSKYSQASIKSIDLYNNKTSNSMYISCVKYPIISEAAETCQDIEWKNIISNMSICKFLPGYNIRENKYSSEQDLQLTYKSNNKVYMVKLPLHDVEGLANVIIKFIKENSNYMTTRDIEINDENILKKIQSLKHKKKSVVDKVDLSIFLDRLYTNKNTSSKYLDLLLILFNLKIYTIKDVKYDDDNIISIKDIKYDNDKLIIKRTTS